VKEAMVATRDVMESTCVDDTGILLPQGNDSDIDRFILFVQNKDATIRFPMRLYRNSTRKNERARFVSRLSLETRAARRQNPRVSLFPFSFIRLLTHYFDLVRIFEIWYSTPTLNQQTSAALDEASEIVVEPQKEQ